MTTEAWWTSRLARIPREMERSGTVASRERARLAKERGVDILPLKGSAHEPPAPHVAEALRAAAAQHVMPPAVGMLELRKAIAEKLDRINGISADPETQVLVTNGAKQALHVVLASLLDRGDEVVFPTPAYVFGGTIELAGGVPRPVPMSEANGYRWDPERLDRAITPRTKVLLVNNPANPSGFVATPEDLRGVAEVAHRHDLVVLADQSHERLVYDGRRHYSLAALPEAAHRTVTVFSMTKAHNLQGYRVGYATGPVPILETAAKVLEWASLANNFLSQVAALAVLTGPQDQVDAFVARCEENRNRISAAIEDTEGLSAIKPQGGSYHFLNVSGLGMSGEEFADRLLTEYGVLTAPGRVFGEPDHVRLSALGSEPEVITRATERLQRACAAFRKK